MTTQSAADGAALSIGGRGAREAGATAKFAGSGGAIIGTLPEESTFDRLVEKLGALDCRVIRPEFVPSLAQQVGQV